MNIHTQSLIEKLTDHFHTNQICQDKLQVQNSIANLIQKASSANSYFNPVGNVWTSQAVDINYFNQLNRQPSSTPMDSSPSSSPINCPTSSPTAPASPGSSSEDDSNTGFHFVEALNLSMSDLPIEFLQESRARELNMVDNETDLLFNAPTFSVLNFTPNVPITAVRPVSRNASKENCPQIQVVNDVFVSALPKTEVPVAAIPPPPPKPNEMSKFPSDGVADFKHVIYNLLVDNFNHPHECTFVQPISMEVIPGVVKQGFKFNEKENPDKRLPELYAQHIRKSDLRQENQNSVFIQDLYKFYLRACVELLSKYFVKYDKYTFLYDDIQLFIAGGSLEEAEKRISRMGTIQRRQKRNQSDDFVAIKKSMSKPKRSASAESSVERKKRRNL